MSEISSSETIKNNFKIKLDELNLRLRQVLQNLDLDSNIESFTKIYESFFLIESELEKLENNLDLNSLDNISEINRIIDIKILRLFSPYISYYKLNLMQNIR